MTKEQTTPNAWLTRAGRHGQDETAALQEGLAIIGFEEVTDLSAMKSPEEIAAKVRQVFPEASEPRITAWAAQLTAFVLHMQLGDLVVLPLKTQAGRIALGRVTGPYGFRPVAGKPRHTRPVQWVRVDVPRSTIQQDLLHSLGAFLTVCGVRRNGAAERLLQVLQGKQDPGPPVGRISRGKEVTSGPAATTEATAEETAVDVVELAHDQIVARIEGRFRGHDLARLVEAILRANGYFTQVSPSGRDAGVDILAGKGSLGLDSPRLCVQVKSSSSPADVTVLRALQGSMQTFKAEQGLLVSWGGVTTEVTREARQSFFVVRIWDSQALVEALYQTYDLLPEEIQAELPLKRVWTLVLDDTA